MSMLARDRAKTLSRLIATNKASGTFKRHTALGALDLHSYLSLELCMCNYIVASGGCRSSGSGTTLIAAEQLHRRCFGVEISPAYCDVIVTRWEKLTGKKAKLAKPRTAKKKK
jgi:hypothetical protein